MGIAWGRDRKPSYFIWSGGTDTTRGGSKTLMSLSLFRLRIGHSFGKLKKAK